MNGQKRGNGIAALTMAVLRPLMPYLFVNTGKFFRPKATLGKEGGGLLGAE